MTSWEKLLRKIATLSKDVRFSELKRILESYGYEGRKPGRGSSHWTFRKQGKPPLTLPDNEPIKLVYVKMVKDIIESEDE